MSQVVNAIHLKLSHSPWDKVIYRPFKFFLIIHGIKSTFQLFYFFMMRYIRIHFDKRKSIKNHQDTSITTIKKNTLENKILSTNTTILNNNTKNLNQLNLNESVEIDDRNMSDMNNMSDVMHMNDVNNMSDMSDVMHMSDVKKSNLEDNVPIGIDIGDASIVNDNEKIIYTSLKETQITFKRNFSNRREKNISSSIRKIITNFDFALFIASLPFLYHSSHKILNQFEFFKHRKPLTIFISGSIAGMAISFDKSKAFGMGTYFLVRAFAEWVSYFNARKWVPTVPHTDSILFSLMLMIIMMVFVYSPNLFSPFYYKLFKKFEGEDRFMVKYARYSFRRYVWENYFRVPLWLQDQRTLIESTNDKTNLSDQTKQSVQSEQLVQSEQSKNN